MSRSASEVRDEGLGKLLRELEVPEHRPGFEAELRRRLAAERSPARRLPRRRLGWGIRIAAVATVIAAVAVAIGIPRTQHTPSVLGPEHATAAEIKAKVRTALDQMKNLGGELVYDGPKKGDEARWRFTLTAHGDFDLVGPTPDERMTYDASSGVARSAQRSASLGGGPVFYAERRGVAPGLPDPSPPTWLVPTELETYVRALLADQDPRVGETTYDGRPAWILSVDTVPNAVAPEFSGDRLEVTVDKASGMPVRVLETKSGQFLRELRIEGVTVNGDIPAGTFTLDFPPDAEVSRVDEGFRRVGLDEVQGVVGYAPLVPTWLPQGFELAEVAVAKEGQPTGTEGGNPVSRNVVSLSYRRGLEQVLVTTRSADGGPWSDPLATGEGFVDTPERVVLADGALRGDRADIVLAPRGTPHLWLQTDDLIVTVSGGLGRAQLIQVAESLEAR